jgi:hypothetical protein
MFCIMVDDCDGENKNIKEKREKNSFQIKN